MRILITSAASRFSQVLASDLAGEHVVTLTDRVEVSKDHNFVRSDLPHDATTNDLVRHMEVIIHSTEAGLEASASDRLDFAMRCTYNILRAAVDEGVGRFILLSSLVLLDRYDENLVVTENWRPLPNTDPPTLAFHLAEYVSREFARERGIEVVILRMGPMVWDEDGLRVPTSSALYPDDAVKAVRGAVKGDVSAKMVFHIQSPVPGARYLTTAAEETLMYKPTQR